MGQQTPEFPPLTSASVDPGDRLSFTLFMALALHALVLFGVTFSSPEPGNLAPTLEITLATHSSPQAPEEADFLAQQNQLASGTEDDARQLTTDQVADFADNRVQEVNPVPQPQSATRQEHRDEQVVTTTAESHLVLFTPEEPQPEEEQSDGVPMEETQLMADIRSLQARLDQQRQEYARRPRIHRLTSVATQASEDARYLHEWSTRVEQVGNNNYPQEALRRQITGHLRLLVSLNPNGTIHRVEILQSSGQSVLDEAAVQIVRLAAPFAPFPPEIRQNYDRLEIIRTWNFEISGFTTSR